MKRALISEGVSIVLVLSSMFLFYRCVEFLAEKNFTAGVVSAMIAIVVLRTGAEFGRFAAYKRDE